MTVLFFRLLPVYTLLLLIISITASASLLRSRHTQHDERELIKSVSLGCPGKVCKPLPYFLAQQADVEEKAQCKSEAACEYNTPCMYVPGDTFLCAQHAQYKVSGHVCSLECVDETLTSTGGTGVCNDIKTCASLKDILLRTNNVNLVSDGKCASTDDCPSGECRYKTDGTVDELVCDDGDSYCDFDCVVDDTTPRNIALGGESSGRSYGGVVVQCNTNKMCVGLSGILSVTNNTNLVATAECTGVNDCNGGECRYDDEADELKCDDEYGTYCSPLKDCVEDDRTVAANIAGGL